MGFVITSMLASCGGSTTAPSAPPTTVATTITTTTTIATTTTTSACPALEAKALQLLTAHRLESRGIVAPDEASYRRQAAAIRDSARAAGCPVPVALSQFLK